MCHKYTAAFFTQITWIMSCKLTRNISVVETLLPLCYEYIVREKTGWLCGVRVNIIHPSTNGEEETRKIINKIKIFMFGFLDFVKAIKGKRNQ